MKEAKGIYSSIITNTIKLIFICVVSHPLGLFAKEGLSEVLISGYPIGATVEIVSKSSGKSYKAQLPSRFQNLPKGTYIIKISSINYYSNNIIIDLGPGERRNIIAQLQEVPPTFREAYIGTVSVQSFYGLSKQPKDQLFLGKNLIISPDWLHLARIVRIGKKRQVLLDGRPAKKYDNVANLRFNTQGELAYLANRGCKWIEKKWEDPECVGGKWFVVFRNKEGPRFDIITELVFSRTGEIGYVAFRNCKWKITRNGHRTCHSPKSYVVLSGVLSQPYENNVYLRYISSQRFAYLAFQNSQWIMYLNGKRSKYHYDYIQDLRLTKRHIFYRAFKKQKWFLNVDGRESQPYADVSDPIFGTNGNLAFNASKDCHFEAHTCITGKRFVVSNWQEGPRFDNVFGMRYSPKNSLVYIAIRSCVWDVNFCRGGTWYVIMNQKRSPPYHFIQWYNVHFTSDDELVYVANRGCKWDQASRCDGGEWFVVFKGQEGPKYDAIRGLTINTKNQIAYIANRGKKHFVVRNTEEGKPFDTINDLLWGRNGDLVYSASIEDKVAVVLNNTIGKKYDAIHNLMVSAGGQIIYSAELHQKEFIVVAKHEGPRFKKILSVRLDKKNKMLAYLAVDEQNRLWRKTLKLASIQIRKGR